MNLIPFPDKKYSIIYADPPWNIKYFKETSKGQNSCVLPYNVMTNDELYKLPVKDVVNDDAILFIWCVDSKIPILNQLMEDWGFMFKCLGFIWHKKAKTTNGDNAPFPNFTRRSCEYCFIGVRGRFKTINRNVKQLISIPKKEHSAKPAFFRSLIIELCGDLPRIELFSRENIEGWDTWGNQVPSHVQRLITSMEAYNPIERVFET